MLANALRRGSAVVRTVTPALSAVRHGSAYQGDGKTTVRILNKEMDMGLMIDSYATYGFRLNTGVTVLGPMAIFPKTVFSWQVSCSADVTAESLRFFKLLEPKIDLLVLGLETSERQVSGAVYAAARQNDINVEILTTEHACSTFNFLNSEGRSVAACIIPPLNITVNEDDMLRSKLHYGDLYSTSLD